MHQAEAHAVFQLVDHLGIGEVRYSVAILAAFQRQHLQAGIGKLHAENRASPAKTDNDGVCLFFLPRHGQPLSPETETGPSG